jgi:hypothetical protein
MEATMMAYTTNRAAIQFWDARRPKIRRPVDTRFIELSAPSFERAEARRSQVRRLVALPLIVR